MEAAAQNLSRIAAETVALVQRECESEGIELAVALAKLPDSEMEASEIGQVVDEGWWSVAARRTR